MLPETKLKKRFYPSNTVPNSLKRFKNNSYIYQEEAPDELTNSKLKKRCPFCGRKIRSKAKICPRCGHVLDSKVGTL